MQTSTRHQHDLVARRQIGPEDGAPSGWHDADCASREFDLRSGDKLRQGRRLSAPPCCACVNTGLPPTCKESGFPALVFVPLRRSGREVSVDDQRQRADATEVVHDRRNRVVCDVGEWSGAELGLDLTRDDRLGAQTLEHEAKGATRDLKDESGLSARLIDRPTAACMQQT